MLKNLRRKLVAGGVVCTMALGMGVIAPPTTVKACDYSTPAIGSYPGYIMSVQNGGYDSNVQKIQHFLNGLASSSGDYAYYVGSEDGYFGIKTQNAVEHFQQRHSLSSDGRVGPNTWSAMQYHR
ncbi:Putative peptidoglycan binding domain-containing protein [Clostridium cavendishii DSM 21758]|uniref:Putative peptidoglycan binding domain-containing protein n=1 Tax=Clostridium cavendishii DSM 21758 TaxID=1121302 RepID=A0A1M6I2U2_9CLOT|nr:peptidoglycan-binding domain-containing protein [Clostridium cavendishii]SHJ28594.1 Putative peptidoglycan binding domain-containing protein [Clostridium cavendishii DSM 21758]